MIRAWTKKLGGVPPGLAERLGAECRGYWKRIALAHHHRSTAVRWLLADPSGSSPGTSRSSGDVGETRSGAPRAQLRSRHQRTGEQGTKPVLLVIDDLDKVRDEETQHELFIDRATAWMRLPCGVLATLPLDVLFTERGRELDHVWGEIGILDLFSFLSHAEHCGRHSAWRTPCSLAWVPFSTFSSPLAQLPCSPTSSAIGMRIFPAACHGPSCMPVQRASPMPWTLATTMSWTIILILFSMR